MIASTYVEYPLGGSLSRARVFLSDIILTLPVGTPAPAYEQEHLDAVGDYLIAFDVLAATRQALPAVVPLPKQAHSDICKVRQRQS